MFISALSRPHNFFFLSVLFFTGGILLANWQTNFVWLILIAAAAAAAVPMIFKNKPALILLAVLLPAGGLYHYFYNSQLAALPSLLDLFDAGLPAALMKAAYRRLFTFDQAGLLAGITLGEKDGLTKELLNQLSLSGVRHLTALSGLHVSIIVLGIANVLRFLMPARRKLNFVALIILALAFVILTGLRVSALRAAFMASVVGLSKISERLYSPRNSLMAAGFILLLSNPSLLVFDIGFQLSFLAMAGIVYLIPLLKKIPGFQTAGFLGWKNYLLMTIAAQFTTAPLLVHYFANFTLTGFIANVLILPAVPATMFLGYLAGVTYYWLAPLAVVISWPAAALLEYQLIVVSVFSAVKLPFNPPLNWWLIGVYYLILGTVVWRLYLIYDKPAQN